VNWAIELEQFNIEFYPWTTIKGQILADFFVEFCNIPESEELPKEGTWVVYVDGSSANQRSGPGLPLLAQKVKGSSMLSSWILSPQIMKRSTKSFWPDYP
jgi:hypothetical protein